MPRFVKRTLATLLVCVATRLLLGSLTGSVDAEPARETHDEVMRVYRAAVLTSMESGRALPRVVETAIFQNEQKVLGPGGMDGYFGWSVAVDGDTALVGLPYYDSGGTVNQGSVHVFRRSGTTWTFEEQLLASDGGLGDTFGSSVAVDGDTVLIGAPHDDLDEHFDQGSAYVFTRSGTTWSEQQKLTASDGAGDYQFGYSVALEVIHCWWGYRGFSCRRRRWRLGLRLHAQRDNLERAAEIKRLRRRAV